MILYLIVLSALIFETTFSGQDNSLVTQNFTNRTFIYNRYEYETKISIMVNSTTEHIMEFYEDTHQWYGFPTRVHVSTNNTIDGENPLFITATQQKGVSSWELPLVVHTARSQMLFQDMSRTLCPHDAGHNITVINPPLVHVTTSNRNNVTVDIKLRRVRDFYLEVNKEVYLNATPSTPKYYYFSFDNNPWNATGGVRGFLPRFNYTIPKSVILIIESDDELCALVSIQNNSCPVFDNENTALYDGYHLTMTTLGGITLTQSMFPNGFYVVFIVKETDEECTGASETDIRSWFQPATAGRRKNFRLLALATISYGEYVTAALAALALLAALLMLVALLARLSYSCRCTEEVVVVDEDSQPSTSGGGQSADDTQPIVSRTASAVSLSDDERSLDGSMPRALTVAVLSRAMPNAHSRRADRYFWSALTVAVVYSLPVVQLLFTYQRMVFQTGDQDVCYYNFLCAHPLGSLSDFNHVYSNIGYVVLGLVFMGQVRARQRAARGRSPNTGIPQHHGLLYSMGLALAMEGALSACYHLCPNKMNFQFDSSFMYVLAALVVVKLYQSRHSDVNASAHATFMVLALLMALGVLGIMYPSVWFWALFTALHVLACALLTLNIYYVNRFKYGGVGLRAWRALRARGRRALRPRYGARAVLLALTNLANWALAGYGLYSHNKDFGRHLLAILMGNAILYTLFYVCMKLMHGERLPGHTWLYLVLAHAAWFAALWLFLRSGTKWSETPAGSRRHNAACSALQFYDHHDMWHLASAAALFLSLNMLLTVDDPLANTPRDQLPVF